MSLLFLDNKRDNEIPTHFIHEIKTKGTYVNCGNIIHSKLMRFHQKIDNSVRPILLMLNTASVGQTPWAS